MSRTRFLQIGRYLHLHVADNSVALPVGADGYDKLYRVREFLNIISSNISRRRNHGSSKGQTVFRTVHQEEPNLMGYKALGVIRVPNWLCL